MITYLQSLSYFDNTLFDYAVALGTILVGVVALWIVKSFVLRSFRRLPSTTASIWNQYAVSLINTFIVPLCYLGIVYLAVTALVLPPLLAKAIRVATTSVLAIFGIRFVLSLIRYVLFDVWLPQQAEHLSLEPRLSGLMPALSLLVWGIGIIFLLDNLGFNVGAIVAGLGIGGIAVGLAASAVLGDAFAYLAILFDRPFELGDFILVGDYMGNVEYIGMKTTRLRSLSGEQIVFSNKDLTDSRVRNYKRMRERRVVFTVGLTYDTTLAQIKEAPQLIKTIIDSTPNTRFNRSHFFAFGDFSLNIETVYYVLSSDYMVYMDVQQAINLQLKEVFEQHGIDFAFPTRTLHILNASGHGGNTSSPQP
jgi:small-conductance mechanosensitive channel